MKENTAMEKNTTNENEVDPDVDKDTSHVHRDDDDCSNGLRRERGIGAVGDTSIGDDVFNGETMNGTAMVVVMGKGTQTITNELFSATPPTSPVRTNTEERNQNEDEASTPQRCTLAKKLEKHTSSPSSMEVSVVAGDGGDGGDSSMAKLNGTSFKN
mmetsp:Transcript_23335/g.34423  ORF Transcript_23335/g.34423 Transcript_23335/m.34423 type:complete len:157 (+) Transcript_23335:3-473(+)